MSMPRLKIKCLNALCDDYENISSIKTDLLQNARHAVSDKEIANCLMSLTNNGLISVYMFSDEYKYVKINNMGDDLSNMWFYITEKGRIFLEQNWKE